MPSLLAPLLFAQVLTASGAEAVAFSRPVSLHAVTDGSVVVAFDTPTAQAARVEVHSLTPADAGNLPRSAGVAKEESLPTLRHRVTLAGLAPNTFYALSVQAGSAHESGSFWTAPATGALEPFTFVVVGDSRDHGAWAEVAHSILEKKPRFLLITGDDVLHGGVEPDWDDFFRAGQDLFATVPVFTVRGNHDVGGGYEDQNPVPPGPSPLYYSFDYGSARFLALDTNQPDDPGMQAYAKQILQAPHQGPLFTFHHHPLYSCGPHGSSPKLQEIYQPLFESGHVTVDFSGHDHDLEQWETIGGVHYSVSGGGGTLLYPLLSCKGPFARSERGYLVVSVAGNTVVETFYDWRGNNLYSTGPFAAVGSSVTTGAPR